MNFKKSLVLMLAFAPLCAQAQGHFYGEAQLNYNWLDFSHAETASFFSPSRINAPSAHIDDAVGYGVGLGYQFTDYFRTAIIGQARPDISFSVTDDGSETATGSLDNYTVMFNAYLSSPALSNTALQPYLLGGLGIAYNTTSGIYWPLAAQTEFGKSRSFLAAQLGIGSLYRLSPAWDLDLNYTYLTLGNSANSGQYSGVASNGTPAFGAPTKLVQVHSNQLAIGLHYRFAD